MLNPLTEIYRDDWLLAVHKPAGLLVHRSPIDKHETEFALQYARAMNGGEHVYPVHRLDRPTSGVLLFARDPETARTLGLAMMAGAVSKTYLAMVRGWAPEQGVVAVDLGQIYGATVGAGLEDCHHDLQRVDGFRATAFVVSVLV